MDAVVSSKVHDPFERGCSRVTFAATLHRAGRGDDAAFAQLGAAPSVERRRWGAPDASS